MLNLNKAKWEKVDKKTEEFIYGNIRFVKPIDFVAVKLSCSLCKTLIASVEDVESMKENDICEQCYDLYYYTNQEKWKNGWRPNIHI